MIFNYAYRGKVYTVELQGSAVLVDGQPLAADGNAGVVARRGRDIYVHFEGRSYRLQRVAGQAAGGAAVGGESVLRAPMPGQVRQVLVSEGQQVAAGETLLVLEAMKMEIRIQAPGAAKVAKVQVQQGQSVERDQTLVELVSDAG